MQIVEARATARDRLNSEGLATRLGGVNQHLSVADAVDRWQVEPNASSKDEQAG